MNRSKCVHRFTLVRNGKGAPVDGIQPRTGLVPVTGFSNLECLIEGIKSKSRPSIIGRIAGAAFVVTWFADGIREGDVLQVTRGPARAVGKEFVLAEILDDTGRPENPYYTGVLAQYKHG